MGKHKQKPSGPIILPQQAPVIGLYFWQKKELEVWEQKEQKNPGWYSKPRLEILDKNTSVYAPFVNRKMTEILSDELKNRGAGGSPSSAQIQRAEWLLSTKSSCLIAPIIGETRKTIHEETAPRLEGHLKKLKKHRMFFHIPSEEWALALPENSSDNENCWTWKTWLVLENMIEDPNAEERRWARGEIREYVRFAFGNYEGFLKDSTVKAYGKLFDLLGEKGGEIKLDQNSWKQLEEQAGNSTKIVQFEHRGNKANFMVKWEDGEPKCYVSEQGIAIMETTANWQVGMDPEGYMAHPMVQRELDGARSSGSDSKHFFTLFKHILNEEKTWVVGESWELREVFRGAHEKAEQRLLARFPEMLREFSDRLISLIRSAVHEPQ